MALRMIYTSHARKHPRHRLDIASNARDYALGVSGTDNIFTDEKEMVIVSDKEITSNLTQPTRVLPQYTATTRTSLTIREDSLPRLPGSFTVTSNGQQHPLFLIERSRPSRTHRQELLLPSDPFGTPLLTLRRNVGHLPISYRVEDPTGTTVLDLQGNFFVPFTGAKSTGYLIDPVRGDRIELAVKGSYRNRTGIIINAATGEELVSMQSNIFQARTIVGGRRTYEVGVKEGMDLALAVMLVVAMDARAA